VPSKICRAAFIALDAGDSANRVVFQIKNIIIAKKNCFTGISEFLIPSRKSGPGRSLPLELNYMLHFLAIEACSTATICPFICPSSAAVCLSPPTKNAAGQKTTTAAAVAQPS
jgi:hypothetical protein